MESSVAHQVVLEEKIVEIMKLKEQNEKLREENFELKEMVEEMKSQLPTASGENEALDSKDSDCDDEGKENAGKPSKMSKKSKIVVLVNTSYGVKFEQENLCVLKLHLSTKMSDMMQRIYHQSKIPPHAQELFLAGGKVPLECNGCLADQGFKSFSSVEVKKRNFSSLEIDIEVYSLTKKFISMTFDVSKTIKELKSMLGVKEAQCLVLTCLEMSVTYTDRSYPQNNRQEKRQEKINPGISLCDLSEHETLSDVLSIPVVMKAAILEDWLREQKEISDANTASTSYRREYSHNNKLPKLLFRLF